MHINLKCVLNQSQHTKIPNSQKCLTFTNIFGALVCRLCIYIFNTVTFKITHKIHIVAEKQLLPHFPSYLTLLSFEFLYIASALGISRSFPLTFRLCNLYLHKKTLSPITSQGDVLFPAVLYVRQRDSNLTANVCCFVHLFVFCSILADSRWPHALKVYLLLFQNVQLNLKTHSLSSLENQHNAELSRGGILLR